jgi:hypothetical protein
MISPGTLENNTRRCTEVYDFERHFLFCETGVVVEMNTEEFEDTLAPPKPIAFILYL